MSVTLPPDDSALEDLYRRFYERTVRFLIYLGCPREDARDLAQEAFVRVLANIGRFHGDAAWQYIKTTAHHLLLNDIRKTHSLKAGAPTVSIEGVADPTAPDPTAEAKVIIDEQTHILRNRYRKAIAALPEGLRQCLLLRQRGYSGEQIAEILRIPHTTVRSRLHEAKRQLQAELGEAPAEIDWREVAGESDDEE